MRWNTIKIQPRAVNSFDIEVYDRLGKPRYILVINSDGEELRIFTKDTEENPAILLEATLEPRHGSEKKVNFAYKVA